MRNNKIIRTFFALLLAVALSLSATACKSDGKYKPGEMSKPGDMSEMSKPGEMSEESSTMENEPKNAEEAAARFDELMAQENAILSENSALWEKVFMSADKGQAMIEDGGNYGDFLLKTIEAAKDQFSADELKLLNEGAEKIRDIENELAMLEQKYPELGEKMPGEGDMVAPPDGSSQPFPSFTGKDLDGNAVDSELFSGNSVTVVNFWFTTCGPCVGELAELDALNKELAQKGGELIGINVFTMDGGETDISEAKAVLEKKGATYRNIYFASDSEAGKFTDGIYAYPTTYVVDRNGNIVGEPIVGAITSQKQLEALRQLIDETIEKDGKMIPLASTSAQKTPPACCRS